MRWGLAAALLSLLGCKNDQGLRELKFEEIAVATGDFDQVEAALARMDIGYTPYEGYIDRAVYDPEINPAVMSLKSEQLFTGQVDNAAEIGLYDAVFVDSGTRGFGAYVYNGVEADDSLVTNATALEHVQKYVEAGGTLVVSDWAYELIQTLWPSQITFAGDGATLDDAQRGLSNQVIASVLSTAAEEKLDGNTTVDLSFDYSYWTVMTDVGPDVTVYLAGDVDYRASDEEGTAQLVGVPLMVSFEVDGGQVLYTSFHWRAQRAEVTDGLLQAALEGLNPGSANETGTGEVSGE